MQSGQPRPKNTKQATVTKDKNNNKIVAFTPEEEFSFPKLGVSIKDLEHLYNILAFQNSG